MGDSFLWEGSMFVFQFVGGGGRGHILAQGPQLKISSCGKGKEELKKGMRMAMALRPRA